MRSVLSSLPRGTRLLVVAALASALSAPSVAAAAGGQGTIDLSGRVGKVRLGDGLKAVRAFAGRPTRTIRGRGEGTPRFTEYRYQCGQGCSTSYYFTARGRLANFITTSKRWRTAAGSRVGDLLKAAEAAEGKQSVIGGGCGASGPVIRKSGGADLFLTFGDPAEGGETQVVALALAGKSSVLGC